MFRKPKKKPTALRNSSGGGDVDIDSAAAKAATTGTKTKKKRPRQTSCDSSSSDDGEQDAAENTSDLLQQIRQERERSDSTKKTTLLHTVAPITAATKMKSKPLMQQFKSSDHETTRFLSAQDMATRTAEYHPANIAAASSDRNKSATDAAADTEKNAALAALRKQPRNKFLAGPLRATTFVRTTARFDYQPDICKDYKETGFCGFGDTCIYLHDRGDTKSGWQMEQEYEERKRKEEDKKSREMDRFMKSMMCGEVGTAVASSKAKEGGEDFDHDYSNNQSNKHNNLDDGIPYACHICRGPFRNPVVTTCGHYFCESCMQHRLRESTPSSSCCPICQKDTHGVLNHPTKLVTKKRRLVGRDGTWEEYLEKK